MDNATGNLILLQICRKHEDMSLRLIDYIIDEYNVDLQCHGLAPGVIDHVKTMIKGQKPSTKNSNLPLFLWDLVANDRTALDVDKFDYLQRDSKQCNIKLSTSFKRLPYIMKVFCIIVSIVLCCQS